MTLKVFKVNAALCDKTQESAARVLILAILIKMSRKFLDATRKYSDLHLGRTRIAFMALSFLYLVGFLALR